jgi:O-methyltransferase
MKAIKTIDQILSRFPLVSNQVNRTELRVILRELNRILKNNVPGDVVEMGCYVGTTALFLQRLLTNSGRQLYLYDSFEGLPEKTEPDLSPVGEQFRAGELRASKTELSNHFIHAGLPVPRVKKAWFGNLKSTDLPSAVAFAYLDGDFYASILQSLKLVWPKLCPGAVVVVDDYNAEALPGVRRALDEWSQRHGFSLHTEASLAILRPA